MSEIICRTDNNHHTNKLWLSCDGVMNFRWQFFNYLVQKRNNKQAALELSFRCDRDMDREVCGKNKNRDFATFYLGLLTYTQSAQCVIF